jgi:hypothetical protein
MRFFNKNKKCDIIDWFENGRFGFLGYFTFKFSFRDFTMEINFLAKIWFRLKVVQIGNNLRNLLD